MPRWFLWALLALVSWGVWAILAKVIGDGLSAAQSQALSTMGLLPIFVTLAVSKKTAHIPKRGRGRAAAFAAGVCGCLGNLAYYHALNSGGKAVVVVPLTALYPLVTVLLAVAILKEKLNRIQLGGVLLSIVAIYLFNVQREEGFWNGALLIILLPILFWGVAGLLQKISTNYISGEASTLWFLAAFIPVAGIILLTQPLPQSIATRILVLVVALGFFFGLGNYGILAAFANQGQASVITPLSGLYPLVSIPLALWLFHEKIGMRESAGIALAIVSVLALSRETVRNAMASAAPEAVK